MFEVQCIRYGKRTASTSHIATERRAREVAERYIADKAEAAQVWQSTKSGPLLVVEYAGTPEAAPTQAEPTFESITAMLPDVAIGMARTVRLHYGG